uniref:Uncharacterized protein n=1 Tax=Romanomermis culicivorax TaxID=13658 RepID=A0A915L377_ROMCU
MQIFFERFSHRTGR